MESSGHETEKNREDETGGEERRSGDRRGRGDGEIAEANEKRQRTKGGGGKVAHLSFNNSRKRCSLLVNPSVSARTQLRDFRRNITCATIGVCMCACLLMELPGSGSATVSHRVSSVSLTVPVQASPTYSEKEHGVYAPKEKSKEEQGASEHLSTAYSADIDGNKYLIGSPRGQLVVQVTARSTVVGKGFHRTMLTTVHIRGNTAEDSETRGKDAEKGGKRDKTGSQPDGGNTGTQKEESRDTLGKPRERGAEKGSKNGEGEIGDEVLESEKEADDGIDVVWGGEHRWDTKKGKSGAKIRSNYSAGGQRMSGRQSESVTLSPEKGELTGRNEEGNVDIAHYDFVDDNHLVCTVRCEYALDKIAYVDPDQTWELGIRGHSTPVQRQAADRVSDTPFSTDFAQMGSVEVFPPAVDLEAPVFETHLPPILHVRQTVEDVLLTRVSSSPQKNDSHVAASNFGIAHGTASATRTSGNAFPEESSSFSTSLPTDDKYLDTLRDGESDDGTYITDGKVNQTKDKKEGENKNCGGAKDGNRIAEESGEQACHGATSRKADDNIHGTREGKNLHGGSSDVTFPGGSKASKRDCCFEAVVDVELPFHHRYDAACSGCGGFSIHQVETPVVEVVCCRGSAKAQGKAELQVHRGFYQDESVRTTCPHGSIEKCYHQNQITERQQQRSQKQSSYEKTVAADESRTCAACSHSYCTSVKAVATAVDPEPKGADASFSDGSMPFDGYDSRCYERPSLSDQLEAINMSNTESNTGGKAYDQRGAQVDQDAAEGNTGGQGGKIGARTHESKKECGGGEQTTRFFLQVPVGSAEDLTWATVVTLAAVGISLVATAWILGYAEAQRAAAKEMYEGNFTIAF